MLHCRVSQKSMITSGAQLIDFWLPGRYEAFACTCHSQLLLRIMRYLCTIQANGETYWLIQHSGHAVHEKLKILRPM